MPVDFEFVLPPLSNIPLSDRPLSTPPEVKREFNPTAPASSHAPWSFNVLKDYLQSLESSPVRNFLLEVANMDKSTLALERALCEKYKTTFEDEAQVKYLLKTVLAARHYTLALLYQYKPHDKEAQFSCLLENYKRMRFMTQIEVLLYRVLRHPSYATEHQQFLIAFFEEIQANTQTMNNGAALHFVSNSTQLSNFFDHTQIMMDLFLTHVLAKVEFAPLTQEEIKSLFPVFEWVALHYKDKATFYYAIGKNKLANEALLGGRKYYLELRVLFDHMSKKCDPQFLAAHHQKLDDITNVQYNQLKKENESDLKRGVYADILETVMIFTNPGTKLSLNVDNLKEILKSTHKRLGKLKSSIPSSPESTKLIKESIELLDTAIRRHYQNDLELLTIARQITIKLITLFDKEEQNAIVIQIKGQLTLYSNETRLYESEIRKSSEAGITNKTLALITSYKAEIEDSRKKLEDLMAKFKNSQEAIESLRQELESAKAQPAPVVSKAAPEAPPAEVVYRNEAELAQLREAVGGRSPAYYPAYQPWYPQPLVFLPPRLPEGLPCRYHPYPYMEYNANMIGALKAKPAEVVDCLRHFVQDSRPCAPNHNDALRNAIARCRYNSDFKAFLALLSLVGKDARPDYAFRRLYNAAFLSDIFPLLPDFHEPFMEAWQGFVASELERSIHNKRTIDSYAFLNLLLLAEYQTLKKSYPTKSVAEHINVLISNILDIMNPQNLGDRHQLETRIKQGLPELMTRFEVYQSSPKAITFSASQSPQQARVDIHAPSPSYLLPNPGLRGGS